MEQIFYEPKTMYHSCGVTIRDAEPKDDAAICAVLSLVRNVFPTVYAFIQGDQDEWRFIEVWGDNEAIETECAQWIAAEMMRQQERLVADV